jgi:hypothetical protein
LKQIALGILVHHDQQRRFPSNGWSPQWVGDPERGTGRDQPGGIFYNVLPFIEQTNIYGMPGTGGGISAAEKRRLSTQMIGTVVPFFYCPTRRAPRAVWTGVTYFNADTGGQVAKNDFAACEGDSHRLMNNVPNSLAQVDRAGFAWESNTDRNGVLFFLSEVSVEQIADGTTNTYLMGEKYMNPDDYFTGESPGNNETTYCGHAADTARGTQVPPRPDTPGVVDDERFGSAHQAACHFAMCDASVQIVSYGVDREIHRRRGTREGREVAESE